MTSTAIEKAPERTIRLPVGLLLSIGAEKPERGPGRAIDHFRPKPGQLAQYAAEAARFTEHYGAEPRELTDVHFLANEVPAVLDVRLLAFSQSGIRGVGDTNFAALADESEFEERVFGTRSFTDGFTFFPKDLSEVRPELRDSWEGEPVRGELKGMTDPETRKRVDALQIKIVTSLEFCLPEIMGLGKVARISTSGRASTRNLYKALWAEWEAFGYRLAGIPFRLTLRPRGTQRFEAKEKKYVQTTVYELVIDTPHTVAELRQAIEQHRQAFGAPNRDRLAIEGRALVDAMALPAPQEEERTREDVAAEPADWLLNTIARLEHEVGEEAKRMVLAGVFGADDARELTPENAERYRAMLEAAVPAEPVEGEIVSDEESTEGERSTATTEAGDAADVAPSVGESGAETSAESTQPQGADPGGDAAPSAPEPLPGEPSGLMDPVDVAGDLLVPVGQMIDHPLRDMSDTWIKWALENHRYFTAHEAFFAGLELWARSRLPEIWEKTRGA